MNCYIVYTSIDDSDTQVANLGLIGIYTDETIARSLVDAHNVERDRLFAEFDDYICREANARLKFKWSNPDANPQELTAYSLRTSRSAPVPYPDAPKLFIKELPIHQLNLEGWIK